MNITNGEVVAEYFKLLTDKEIRQLYKIYENDFLLFNYQFEFRGMQFNVPKLEPGPPPPGTNNSNQLSLNLSFVLVSILTFLLLFFLISH